MSLITEPKISVIMSAFNADRFLNKAIGSILSQTFSDFELILIDDGSTDKTGQIIDQLSKIDPRIVAIRNPENYGLVKSLNIGLQKAKGEYIARMDADDISLPDRFEKQFKYLQSNPSVFLVGGGAIIIDENGQFLSKKLVITDKEKIMRTLGVQNHFVHPSIMFRNDRKHSYREKFLNAEDYDFYLCLLSEGKEMQNLKDYIVQYRYNPKSISFQKRIQMMMFDEKAKQFFRERKLNGRDAYESFNPNTLLNVKLEDLDKTRLEKFIMTSFASLDMANIESSIQLYRSRYGYWNRFAIYQWVPRLPKPLRNLLFKIYTFLYYFFL